MENLHNTRDLVAFNALLLSMLTAEEGSTTWAYADSNGIPSIGIGFNLRTTANLKLIAASLGIQTDGEVPVWAANDAQLTQIQKNQIATNEQSFYQQLVTAASASYPVTVNPLKDSTNAAANAFNNIMLARSQEWYFQDDPVQATSFAMSSVTGKNIFSQIIPSYIATANATTALDANTNAVIPYSNELMAITSLAYDNVAGPTAPTMDADIEAGNRADAWYEIRFDSNGGTNPLGSIAERRYLESQVFDLYGSDADPNGNGLAAGLSAMAPDQALLAIDPVFQMYAKYRSSIVSYDATYAYEVGAGNADANYASFEASLGTSDGASFEIQTTDQASVGWVSEALPIVLLSNTKRFYLVEYDESMTVYRPNHVSGVAIYLVPGFAGRLGKG